MNFLIFTWLLFLSPAGNLSDDKIWDGDGGDQLWSNPLNWNDNILPESDADVIINTTSIVFLDVLEYTVESINLSNGAHLIISEGTTLFTTKGGANGSDGVRLIGNSDLETQLTISGNLNVGMADAPGDAVDINEYGKVHVTQQGVLTIDNAGSDGMEITGSLINEGLIFIADTKSEGIKTAGGSATQGVIHNLGSGQITFTRIGKKAINMTGNVTFLNDGVIQILDHTDYAFRSTDNFLVNNGTFHASGIIDAEEFQHGKDGIMSVSNPIGMLVFDDETHFSENTISIRIDGAEMGIGYNQIQIQEGLLTLDNSTLELSGSYQPVLDESFIIFKIQGPDNIIGTFNNLSEGTIFMFNNTIFQITYFGGDGNDVVLTVIAVDADGDGFFSDEDCDDNNAFVNSGVVEIPYNGLDDDCDPTTLDDDLDEDGFVLLVDCNDGDNMVFPGAQEIPNNGVDEDCDGEDLVISDNSEVDKEEIEVYPNPAKDFVLIKGSGSSYKTMEIMDASGKLILKEVIGDQGIINIGDWGPGVYFIKLFDEEKLLVEEFIKI